MYIYAYVYVRLCISLYICTYIHMYIYIYYCDIWILTKQRGKVGVDLEYVLGCGISATDAHIAKFVEVLNQTGMCIVINKHTCLWVLIHKYV
jgi:hypothetical protein